MSLLAQLDPFSSQALPKSARTDPSLVQRQGRPFLRGWGLADVVQLTKLVAHKTGHLTSELITHGFYGPRKPSWGVEMTLITSFLRDAGKHSSLADIAFIRALTSLSAYLPSTGPGEAPSVTPLSFVVRSRALRGLLESFDREELGGSDFRPLAATPTTVRTEGSSPAAAVGDRAPEDVEGSAPQLAGARWLAGEWVVDKPLWRAWQADWRRSASPSPAAAADGSSPSSDSRSSSTPTARLPSRSSSASSAGLMTPTDRLHRQQRPRVILYLHGGAYYAFSASTHRNLTARLSAATESRVFALNYRLSPETRFPGPLHDAVLAYLRLRDEEGVGRPGGPELLVAGDSAGGGLCLGLLLYLRDNGYPLPSGAILMSPWVDLTLSCDSWDSNAPFDIVPIPEPGDHLNPVLCYLGPEGAKKYLTHPYASPLFGNFTGLPPLLIQSGEAEVLRDEITLLAHKASLQGVHVMHEVYDEMVHVFQSLSFLPAAKVALASQRDFVLRALPAFRAEALATAAAMDEDTVSTSARAELAGAAGNDGRGQTASAGAETSDLLSLQQRPPSVGRRSSTAVVATPAVPLIPPQFRRTRSALSRGSGSSSELASVAQRPALNSYRSHPAQQRKQHPGRSFSSARLQKSASGSGTPALTATYSSLASTSTSATSSPALPSPLAVPPTPPKGRNRSLTNPEVWALIRDFEADAGAVHGCGSGSGGSGSGSYTVRRFAAASDTAAATAAAAAAVVEAVGEST